MPRSPVKYPLEVRQRAVEMVQTSGRPIASVAQELGLNPETLRKKTLQMSAGGVRRVGAVRILSRRRLRWHVVVGLFPTAAADQ
jgi:transposase-like protein